MITFGLGIYIMTEGLTVAGALVACIGLLNMIGAIVRFIHNATC